MARPEPSRCSRAITSFSTVPLKEVLRSFDVAPPANVLEVSPTGWYIATSSQWACW